MQLLEFQTSPNEHVRSSIRNPVQKNEDFHYNNKVNKHKIDNAALMFDVAFSNEVTFLTEV